MSETLTPVDVERKLIQLINDLGRAQAALAQARDLEVDAHHEYKREYTKAVLKSPKLSRGDFTAADKTAWVDRECADLDFAADKAKVIREAAQDRLRVLLAQAEIVRSLGASVRLAYENAGVAA